MGQVLSLPFKLINTTFTYIYGMNYYMFGPGRYNEYNDNTFLASNPSKDSKEDALFKQNARVHLYSLASAFYLYNKPHYRKGTYRDDLMDNLRNVAIPGTGIPLSWFVRNRLLAYAFMTYVPPVVSLLASVHHWITTGGSISQEYATRLLAPNDWFNYWRLNCNIVGLHSYLEGQSVKEDYDMENKWTFLVESEKRGVPISPYLKSPSSLFIKHRNEEGGMGIFCYKNATAGGDWIIQERISNSDWVSSLLPENAPLSTFRVITQSRGALKTTEGVEQSDVTALSCVFRAGRTNAMTDHDSILFDVDTKTGIIQGGTTNAHWYRLGLFQWMRCPWRSGHSYSHHPDNNCEIKGQTVPDIQAMLKVAEESHYKLCPHVPFCGWDIVLCKEKPNMCLLEVNLSCNFFRGSFDKSTYLTYIEEALSTFQAKRLVLDKK